MLVPEAYFDATCLMSEVKSSLLPVSAIEVHLYAYLSCIIALWRGQAIGDWGYSFALTTEGFPFSPEFEDSRKQLVRRGLITVDADGDLLPDKPALTSEQNLIFLEARWNKRRQFLSAAASCALVFPGGSIRYAIGRSPGFGSAVELSQNSPLLTRFDIDVIYREYQIISDALDDVDVDLLSPAVIWLSARVLNDHGEDDGA